MLNHGSTLSDLLCMSNEVAPSLAEFAKNEPQPRRCLLCSVPPTIERQVREGKAAGITYRVIGEWLASIGYENATKGRLEKHFQMAHKPIARDN
jgi:hypothetical protein